MFLKIFHSRNHILQFLLIAVVSFSIFTLPITIAPSVGFNPLYEIFINLLSGNILIIRIIFFLLFFLPIILIQYFATIFGIIQRRHYHFLFIAPILMLSSTNSWSINPVLFGLLLFVIGISNLFQLNRIDNPVVISSTAFIFSIASLFYGVFFWNIILIIIALFIFREFKFRELLMVFGSFTLPYIYIFTWYFINDVFILKWHEFTSQLFNLTFNLLKINSYLQLSFVVFMIGLGIFSVFSVISSLRNKLIQIREYLIFLIVTFIFSILLLIIANENIIYHILLIQFLAAFLYSVYISDIKPKWTHDIVIIVIIIHNVLLIYYA